MAAKPATMITAWAASQAGLLRKERFGDSDPVRELIAIAWSKVEGERSKEPTGRPSTFNLHHSTCFDGTVIH